MSNDDRGYDASTDPRAVRNALKQIEAERARRRGQGPRRKPRQKKSRRGWPTQVYAPDFPAETQEES
jgi:hypothetical protein